MKKLFAVEDFVVFLLYNQVEDSMKNLEDVVVERNRAYWMLETGETGERPSGMITDALGIYSSCTFSLCIINYVDHDAFFLYVQGVYQPYRVQN